MNETKTPPQKSGKSREELFWTRPVVELFPSTTFDDELDQAIPVSIGKGVENARWTRHHPALPGPPHSTLHPPPATAPAPAPPLSSPTPHHHDGDPAPPSRGGVSLRPHRLQPRGIDVLDTQIRTHIRARRAVLHREPQSQKRPAVLPPLGQPPRGPSPVLDLIVLPTGVLDGVHIMQRTARPDSVHPARFVVLVPRPTLLFPHRVGDELLTVGVEGVGDVLARVEGFEALALHFGDGLEGVGGDAAEGAHDRAVFDGPGGADVGDEVGEGGDR